MLKKIIILFVFMFLVNACGSHDRIYNTTVCKHQHEHNKKCPDGCEKKHICNDECDD